MRTASTPGSARRNLSLLIGAQALAQISSVALVTVSSLVTFDLATRKGLATLPLALMMLVSAALLMPVARFMQHRGRRGGFIVGAVCGVLSGLVGLWAVRVASLPLLIAAHVLAGIYTACTSFYRFAAAEAAPAVPRARVTSWVIAGGIVAAIVGPWLARHSVDFTSRRYMGTYLVITALALLALIALDALRLPPMPRPVAGSAPRPLAVIVRQPLFVLAVVGSTTGFAVMSMIMSATPLAMQMCGFGVGRSSQVIQWHMLGMFAPSLVVGEVMPRLGTERTMLLGVLLLALQIALAATGQSYGHFAWGLVLLGIGWNFLYVGGTTLLAQCWRPGEEGRVQAAHDLLVFAVASAASMASGGLLVTSGWTALNYTALPLMLIVTALLLLRLRAAVPQPR